MSIPSTAPTDGPLDSTGAPDGGTPDGGTPADGIPDAGGAEAWAPGDRDLPQLQQTVWS